MAFYLPCSALASAMSERVKTNRANVIIIMSVK
jgi:hypothetical protein